MAKNNKNQDYRIGIESRLRTVEVKIDEIILNHIPHLQNKIDKIQWLLITNLIGLIFLLLQRYLK